MPAPKTHPAASDTAGLVYQFKITLLDSEPRIWRRILVPDETFDALHAHIQTAMGWTNSHLHRFEIGNLICGDPELLQEGLGIRERLDSRQTKLSELIDSKRGLKKFKYLYDFGDDWEHAIEFEGAVPVKPGEQYPCCIDGKGACPPEDVGGVSGYQEFLEAIGNPQHPEHEFYLELIDDEFDPESFSAAKATQAMQKGLSSWRNYR